MCFFNRRSETQFWGAENIRGSFKIFFKLKIFKLYTFYFLKIFIKFNQKYQQIKNCIKNIEKFWKLNFFSKLVKNMSEYWVQLIHPD